MSENNPLVSIIVRTKDRPGLLKRALQSIAEQTYRPIEVVLVNDGGCDLDIEDIKNILQDVSLNYIRLEKNTGRAHAGNVGIENAKGEYIGFLDDDDEYYPGHSSTIMNFLKFHPEYKAAYSDSFLTISQYKPEIDELLETEQYVYYSQDFSRDQLILENYIPINCLIFRRDALIAVKGFDESFDLYEDWDMLIRVTQDGNFYHISEGTVKFRQWSDDCQVTLRSRKEFTDKESYIKLLKKHEEKISREVIYKYFVLSGARHNNFVRMRKDFLKLKENFDNLEEKYENVLEDNKRLQDSEIENGIKISEQEKIISNLKISNQQLMYDFNEIKSSIGWKFLESYRHFKESIFPQNTLRRNLYDMFLKSVKTVKNEGWKSFYQKVMKRVRLKIYGTKIYNTQSSATDNAGDIANLQCRKPVDIIIPVFNGYGELKNCIQGIIEFTDLAFHRIIIIDDKSTEKKVAGYLKKLEDLKDKNITIINNSENLGFVKTVNKGMSISSDDVILLNSDTIVTRNWIDKIQRAAYSKHNIATVTPFSNHAHLCSVPEPLQYNFLPKDFDIITFGDFIDRSSLRYYPEIPFGSGFCLYIRRDALNAIGLFDEELFEKGYGEETDFCLRAKQQGFISILDDSTYVYHIGGVSFESIKDPHILAEKNKMIERNLIKLKTRHPEYNGLISEALTTLKPIHEYLNLRLTLRMGNHN